MTTPTPSFAYRLTSPADKARLDHQIGRVPLPHILVPDANIPHMCALCFETRQSNKPWHLPAN